MKQKNVGNVERALRVALGAGLAIWAIWAIVLLFGSTSLIWLLLYAALIVLGVDFVVTGVRGFCPLYKLLGWSTARSKAHA